MGAGRDVHVHAAGDSGFTSHIRCQGRGLSEADCARYLVDRTMDQAELDGLSWLVYTEHVPWLGIKPRNVVFCQTVGAGPDSLRKFCKSFPFPNYDAAQAQREYNVIRDAVKDVGGKPVTNPLGQEMGTAGQVTTAVNFMRRNVPDLYDKLNQDIGLISCAGYKSWLDFALSSGHPADGVRQPLGVRRGRVPARRGERRGVGRRRTTPTTATAVAAERRERRRQPYLGRVAAFCGRRGAGGRPEGRAGLPDERRGPDRGGAVDRTRQRPEHAQRDGAEGARLLLLQGDRVAVVGGGDSHTSRPDGNPLPKTKIGQIQIPVVNVGAGRQQPGNDGKLGLAGRTWLPLDQDDLPDDPTDPDDPVRRMILEGRTVATTGPLGCPSIAGRYPGDDAVFTGESMDVRVDFRGARVVTDDGVVDDWDDAYGEEEMRARERHNLHVPRWWSWSSDRRTSARERRTPPSWTVPGR